jgi:hypothetical protein
MIFIVHAFYFADEINKVVRFSFSSIALIGQISSKAFYKFTK